MAGSYHRLRPPGEGSSSVNPEIDKSLAQGTRRGASIVPPATPTTLVRQREIDHVAGSLLGHNSVAVVGRGGAGASTVAIEAARKAIRGNGRLIYLDFAHIARADEAVRKALLAAGAPLRTLRVELPPARLVRSYLDEDDVVVLDNLQDTSKFSELQASLPTSVTVSRVSPRSSYTTIVQELTYRDAELLFRSLSGKLELSEQYLRILIEGFGGSALGVRLGAGIIFISGRSGLNQLLDLADSGGYSIESLAGAMWRALPETAARVLSVIFIANWVQVDVGEVAQLAHVTRATARSSLELLAQVGVLVKVSTAYRPQRSLSRFASAIKWTSRELQSEHIDATLDLIRARVQSVQQRLEYAGIWDPQLPSYFDASLQPSNFAVATTGAELARNVAWLEREWTAIEQLLEQQVHERPGGQVSEILDSLRVSLRPLGRDDNLRRLDELAYQASTSAGGLRQRRDAVARLADTLERQGELSDAIAARREALVLARQSGERRTIGRDLVDLARLSSAAGQPPSAIESLEEAVALFREAGLVDDESRALVSLGALYEGVNEIDGAAAAYARALKLLDDPSRASVRASVQLRLGAIHQSRGRLEQAKVAYTAAATEGKDNPLLVALSFEHLGGLLTLAAQFGEAISALQRALAIYQNIGDRIRELTALLMLAQVENAIGNRDSATSTYSSALELSRQMNDPLNQGYALAGLGEISIEINNLQDAARYLEQAVDSFRSAGLPRFEAEALGQLAQVRGLSLDYEKAISLLREALDIYQTLADEEGIVVASRDLGDYYHLAGNERQAANCFEESASHARRLNDKNAEGAALHGLARSYHALNLSSEALAIDQRLQYLREEGQD